MNNLYRIYLFLIFAILSCNEECPSFDRELLHWLPGSLNDTIRFTNIHNDTLSFIISEINIYNDDTKYKSTNKYQCISHANLFATSAIDSDDFISETITYPQKEVVSFKYAIHIDSTIEVFALQTDVIQQVVIPSIFIENRIYKNVLIFEKDTNGNSTHTGFWKIILSKDIGLVKIYEIGNTNVWTLVE